MILGIYIGGAVAMLTASIAFDAFGGTTRTEHAARTLLWPVLVVAWSGTRRTTRSPRGKREGASSALERASGGGRR